MASGTTVFAALDTTGEVVVPAVTGAEGFYEHVDRVMASADGTWLFGSEAADCTFTVAPNVIIYVDNGANDQIYAKAANGTVRLQVYVAS